jgi:hypothetical protein
MTVLGIGYKGKYHNISISKQTDNRYYVTVIPMWRDVEELSFDVVTTLYTSQKRDIVNIFFSMGMPEVLAEEIYTSLKEYNLIVEESKSVPALIEGLPGIHQMAIHPVYRSVHSIKSIIFDLNDHHSDWSKNDIADWLDTLDNAPVFEGPIKPRPLVRYPQINFIGRRENRWLSRIEHQEFIDVEPWSSSETLNFVRINNSRMKIEHPTYKEWLHVMQQETMYKQWVETQEWNKNV